MPERVFEFFSDLHCPHAYLTRYRLRQIEEGYRDRVAFRSRCLSLELVQKQPTPKHILDAETPLLVQQESEIPYRPWPEGRTSRWPVTFLPAFEAVKAAEELDAGKAWALDWRIREAFFAEHRCVSMRHVLAELAGDVGLETEAFLEAWDSGRHRATVVAESREGWEEEGFTHSPSVRLPDGTTHINPGGHWTEMDPDQGWRVMRFDPGREDAVEHLADLLEVTAAEGD